jgi:hypothetical protein
MITHFFSTSAGFWEKVAIVNTLFLGPLARGLEGRFLLLGLAGSRHAKKKAARIGCVLARCIKGIRHGVNIDFPDVLKKSIVKTIT